MNSTTTRQTRPSKPAARRPIMSASELELFKASGEELLIRAIAGRADVRRRILRELDLRSALAEGPRPPRVSRIAPRTSQRCAA